MASYTVNALGQRLAKTTGGATTIFVYDEQGRLLGEYDGTGKLIQETVWLEDLPIATLRPTGSGNPPPIAVYYVHPDHLGSPRAITRPIDNVFVWRWDNVDPFGANPPNENPAGLGAFKYALRFPGQYYDAETRTHYNYFRDYDPSIGRYEQSDPIGLAGGFNTYGIRGTGTNKHIRTLWGFERFHRSIPRVAAGPSFPDHRTHLNSVAPVPVCTLFRTIRWGIHSVHAAGLTTTVTTIAPVGLRVNVP